MHDDELDIDPELVSQLLAEQFRAWSMLPLQRVVSGGTDNAIFRLGSEMTVRLPRIHWSADDAEREFHWLPRLAPHLPLRVPVPLGLGKPSGAFPWHWSVCPWLPGRDAYAEPFASDEEAANDLAEFVATLHRVDLVTGPPQGAPRAGRGVPLATRDDAVREALDELGDAVDRRAASSAWEDALRAPQWDAAPVWIHGDLQPANLLVEAGRLTGVIDWGGLGVGDPAADLIPAWSMFSGKDREAYRAALAVDDATWARGKGWALSVALVALPYYVKTNPTIMSWARRLVAAVLADHRAADR